MSAYIVASARAEAVGEALVSLQSTSPFLTKSDTSRRVSARETWDSDMIERRKNGGTTSFDETRTLFDIPPRLGMARKSHPAQVPNTSIHKKPLSTGAKQLPTPKEQIPTSEKSISTDRQSLSTNGQILSCLEMNRRLLEMNFPALEMDCRSLEMNFLSLEMNCRSLEKDCPALEMDSRRVGKDFLSLGKDSRRDDLSSGTGRGDLASTKHDGNGTVGDGSPVPPMDAQRTIFPKTTTGEETEYNRRQIARRGDPC